jgi:addiction module RelE/StbE family toxin
VRVELSSLAEKQLAKIPDHIVKKFALWVDLVSVEGLAAARAVPGYRDHVLKGQWKGYRAIRLSAAYRAIYEERQTGTIHLVYVEEVNKHDY